MGAFRDLTGLKFGQLTVVQVVDGRRSASGGYYWKCACDCGGSKTTSGNALISGGCKSCGCRRSSEITNIARSKSISRAKVNLSEEDTIIHAEYKIYTRSTGRRNKNISFLLDFSTFKRLILQSCHYCGAEPYRLVTSKRRHNVLTKLVSGIDRVDSDGDYTVENSVSCCSFCNAAKNDSSLHNFKEWVARVKSFNTK